MGNKRVIRIENSPIGSTIEIIKQHGASGVVGGLWKWMFRDRVDPQQLGNLIVAAMKGKCAGFAVQIRQDGKIAFSDQGGHAQMRNDGNKLFTPFTYATVASVGKVITGMAAVRLLDDEPDVYLFTPIAPYLPKAWDQHPSVNKITFMDLLTHKATIGATVKILGGENDVSMARHAVERGDDGPPGYRNVNYILIRLLMFELLNRRSPNPVPPAVRPVHDGHTIPDWRACDEALQNASATVFNNYLQAKLFKPAGSIATYDAPQVNRAYHYHWPYDGEKGGLDNVAFAAGSGGWYMTATGLSNAIDAVRRRGILLTPKRAQEALDLGIGIDGAYDTKLGEKMYCKGGLSNVGGSKGQELSQATLLCMLPDSLEVVILANSKLPPTDVLGWADSVIRPWSTLTGFR